MKDQSFFTHQTMQLGNNIFNMFLRLAFVFILFFINFLSLAISLNCNRDKGMGTKLFVGIYAFLFGFIYLFVNYYSYRVMTLGELCDIDTEQIFPL